MYGPCARCYIWHTQPWEINSDLVIIFINELATLCIGTQGVLLLVNRDVAEYLKQNMFFT